MKIHVAPDLCCGAQRCAEVAGEFYKLKDGFSAFVSEHENFEVPPGMEEAALRGAAECPERAIKIIQDED
jgi:ferredoxin